MATRERRLLEQLLKSWAQDHCSEYTIADFNLTEEAMQKTQSYFTWVLQEKLASVDLLGLADRLELFIENQRQRKQLDGMYCQKCYTFCEFAEPNQFDGTMICYGCLNPCG